MQAVGVNWSFLASRMLLTDFNPEILSIRGNMLIISKLTNLQSDVSVFYLILLNLSIILSISDVTFTLLLVFETSESKHFSQKNREFFYCCIPSTSYYSELTTLCVLVKLYILPGFT